MHGETVKFRNETNIEHTAHIYGRLVSFPRGQNYMNYDILQ